MYVPKEKGFTCTGIVHHNPVLFIHTHTVPFRRNSALMFFRDDRLFHGVDDTSAGIKYSNIDPDQEIRIGAPLTGSKVRPSLNQCLVGRSPLAIATKLASRASDANRS